MKKRNTTSAIHTLASNKTGKQMLRQNIEVCLLLQSDSAARCVITMAISSILQRSLLTGVSLRPSNVYRVNPQSRGFHRQQEFGHRIKHNPTNYPFWSFPAMITLTMSAALLYAFFDFNWMFHNWMPKKFVKWYDDKWDAGVKKFRKIIKIDD